MIDKEKQIREMASDMDYACTKHDLWPEDAKEIARVLHTLGYYKCPNDYVREVRKETAADWYKIIIGRLQELWKEQILTTDNYNALVNYFNKVLKLYDDNKIKNNSRCHKCVYEMVCSKDKDNNRHCPNYKKDSPDGGYYG